MVPNREVCLKPFRLEFFLYFKIWVHRHRGGTQGVSVVSIPRQDIHREAGRSNEEGEERLTPRGRNIDAKLPRFFSLTESNSSDVVRVTD